MSQATRESTGPCDRWKVDAHNENTVLTCHDLDQSEKQRQAKKIRHGCAIIIIIYSSSAGLASRSRASPTPQLELSSKDKKEKCKPSNGASESLRQNVTDQVVGSCRSYARWTSRLASTEPTFFASLYVGLSLVIGNNGRVSKPWLPLCTVH